MVYISLLVFQFYSHAELWGLPVEKAGRRKYKVVRGDAIKALTNAGAGLSASLGGTTGLENPAREPTYINEPSLSKPVMLIYLATAVTLTAFCTQFAVDSIDALSQKANFSKPFIGLVLLPILNNDLTPIQHAIKDDMRQTMNFTIGKCLQTSSFVTPLMVLIAWGMGLDLSLSFDGFEVVSLFASVLLLNYLIIDGKSSWYVKLISPLSSSSVAQKYALIDEHLQDPRSFADRRLVAHCPCRLFRFLIFQSPLCASISCLFHHRGGKRANGGKLSSPMCEGNKCIGSSFRERSRVPLCGLPDLLNHHDAIITGLRYSTTKQSPFS